MNILSYSVIALPEYSFLDGSVNHVLLALLLLVIINSLRMRGRMYFLQQKNKLLLNAFHRTNNSLTLIESAHQELVAENLPPLVAVTVSRLTAEIGDIISSNKGALPILQRKRGGELKTDEYELYSYITSLVNRHREHAENCQVKLNVFKDAGHRACHINEMAFTAALHDLFKRSIDSTRPEGSVNVLVSCRDDRWSMEISNRSSGKDYRKYFGLFLYFVKICCGSNPGLIWHVVRSHGGRISGYEWGQCVDYKITVPLGDNNSPVSAVEEAGHADDLLHVVLIMADKELSGYLKDSLSRSYRVSVYEHYKQITVPLSDENTDIIIIDEETEDSNICSRIKKNKLTSDVPVLLLTTSNDAEHLKELKKCRADRFLPRTVTVERLEAELLFIREESKQQFERVIRLVNTDFSAGFPEDLMLNEKEAGIMSKINEFLKEHLAEKFELKKLADELAMSKSKLFYTVKGITKVNVVRYNIFFKMEQAKKLLLTRKYTVGEVANKVGYEEGQYLGKIFKKYYNCTPTEFMEKQGK